MSDDPGSSGLASPFTGPFGAVEPNVLIAGLEGTVTFWIIRWALHDCAIVPQVGGEWHWFYSVLAVVALVGVVVLGLGVEGLAGAVEYITTRKLWGPNRGKLWGWYVGATAHPTMEKWLAAQRRIWESPGASREFTRRRTRILVARNTAFLLLVLSVTFAVTQRGGIGFLCFLAFALFLWVWLSANRAYHRAVSEAGDMDKGVTK
jgi:hypothetical protein